jgi:hypothetical protein
LYDIRNRRGDYRLGFLLGWTNARSGRGTEAQIMKKLILFAIFAGALGTASAQTAGVMIYAWAGEKTWINIGSTLEVRNGTLNVVPTVPAPVKPTRVYGTPLLRDAAGAYTIPAAGTTAPSNVEIWVNGIHYWPTTDYTISGCVVTPKPAATNWPVNADVRANYDPQ